ncbi:hypothetical protein KJ969_01840 [Patescibacteria group bacterium]|nr:hypothetical protein [Patescibacteria group bacterium]MBU1922357.1 hypothetical protein [Patescibacteria group bacterium]
MTTDDYPKIIQVSIIHEVDLPKKGRVRKQTSTLVQVDNHAQEIKLTDFLLAHEAKRLDTREFLRCPPICTGKHSFTCESLKAIKAEKFITP